MHQWTIKGAIEDPRRKGAVIDLCVDWAAQVLLPEEEPHSWAQLVAEVEERLGDESAIAALGAALGVSVEGAYPADSCAPLALYLEAGDTTAPTVCLVDGALCVASLEEILGAREVEAEEVLDVLLTEEGTVGEVTEQISAAVEGFAHCGGTGRLDLRLCADRSWTPEGWEWSLGINWGPACYDQHHSHYCASGAISAEDCPQAVARDLIESLLLDRH